MRARLRALLAATRLVLRCLGACKPAQSVQTSWRFPSGRHVTSSQSAVTNQAAGEAPEQQRVLPFNGMSEYQAHLQNRVERGVRNASRLVVVDQGLWLGW